MGFASKLHLNKIWKKLAVATVITIFLTMLIMNEVMKEVDEYYTSLDFDAQLEAMSNVAAFSLEGPLWNLDHDTLFNICDSFFENETVSKIVVTDAALGVVYERSMKGQEHDSKFLKTRTVQIIDNEIERGSIELTMTQYFMFQENRRSSQLHIIEMLVLVIIISVILFITIKIITKPLSDLRAALEDIGESRDIIPQIKMETDDEIGELAGSFNMMSYKIYDARKSISQLNEKLEHKVALRTEELNNKNVELLESIEVIKATEEELLASNQNLSRTLRELQEVQDLLVESGKMALLGELVAGVAHEINTPIGVSLTVSSFIEKEVKLLIKKVEAENLTKKEFLDFLDKMDEASGNIVRNLLRAGELIASFKQVAVDQSSQSVRRFNLKEYVDETVMNLHSQYKHRNIEIVNSCDEDLFIVSYPGAYAQILTNLVMNSLIHAFDDHDDGVITISANLVDKNIRLIFHDDGHGIPETYIKKVFNPFFTTKRGLGGTGLGLNITYNISVNILKGNITCTSTQESGTTFVLEVPYHHPDIDESLY
jgi:signal transduction histidine kinase